MSMLATPDNGLALVDHEDPLGNGQASVELVYLKDGVTYHSGVYVSVHGGGPLNLRIVHGNPSPSDTVGTVFELGADGRVAIA